MADVSILFAIAGLAGAQQGIDSLGKSLTGVGQQATAAGAKFQEVGAKVGAATSSLTGVGTQAATAGAKIQEVGTKAAEAGAKFTTVGDSVRKVEDTFTGSMGRIRDTVTGKFVAVGQSSDDAGNKLQTWGQRLSAAGDKAGAFGRDLVLATAPIALMGIGLVKSAADFERSMINIQTVSGATAGEMKQVGEAAKRIGADTTFSSSQAAEALTNLLKNGISLKDGLGGVLDATVNLAAATRTQLGPAADIVSSQMKIFGLSANDASIMADNLYNASIQSKFGLTDMGTALGYAARGAIPLHLSFTDMAAALSVTGNAFNEASSAGTSMATFLNRLTPQSKEASEMMIKLGLATADGSSKFYDAQGRFIGFGAAADLLREKISQLTPQQQQQALMTIFQSEGMQTANAVMMAGSKAFGEAGVAVRQMGTTSEAAAKQMQGFWGAVDKVGGAFESLGNSLIESGFLAFLTSMLTLVSDAIDWLAKMPPVLLNVIAALSGVAAAAGPVLLALAGLRTFFALLAVAGGPITLFAAALVAAGAIAWTFRDDIAGAFSSVVQWVKDKVAEAANFIGLSAPQWTQPIENSMALMPPIVGYHMQQTRELVGKGMDALPTVAVPGLEKLKKVHEETFDQISNKVVTSMRDQVRGIEETQAPLEDQMMALARLGKSYEEMGDQGTKAAVELRKEMTDKVTAEAEKELDAITGNLTLTLEEQATKADEVGTAFQKYGKFAVKAEQEALKASQDFYHDLASNRIDNILDDSTKSLREQHDALVKVAWDFGDMGEKGVRGAREAADAVANLNKKIAEQQDFMLGVGAGLTENQNAWGGWGSSAKRVVEDFSAGATDALANFFMTGELSLQGFGAAVASEFAGEAAKAVIAFASEGIKWMIEWGATTFASMVTGASGMDIATISALFLDTALAPILIVVLAIALALGLLYLAGVDIGDIFSWIADIIGAVLKGAFQAFMAVISALVGIFSTLIDLMSTFVGWIQTIGDELGKGDLKDLLDIFGGGNLFSGIGDIFGGIGNFFGGLFAEGGWVGSGSADGAAIPIIAHDGEFVVNRDSSARYGKLLEAINSGGSMHEAVQAINPGAGLLTVNQYGSAAAMSGGGGGGDTNVHVHGSVVSDSLSTSQIGRKLGRAVRSEDRRLRGRLS